MNTRWLKMGAALIALVALIGLVGLPQPVAPKGIIIQPPTPTGLTVRVWVDKGAYAVGETIQVRFSVSEDAYVYIYDIDAAGKVSLLFPNFYSQNNFVTAGDHVLPDLPSYRLTVTEPTGTEYLQIVASKQAVAITPQFQSTLPFPFLGQDPEAIKMDLQVKVLGIVPEPSRAVNWWSFEVVSGTVPTYGYLNMRSEPSGALVAIDGSLVGYTPLTRPVRAGSHQVVLTKSGYRDWSGRVQVFAGVTTTPPPVRLEPIAPANQPPVAAFTFSPANPVAGAVVTFNASGSYDPDGVITSYAWSFGDGWSGTGSTASHAYGGSGAYTVTLTVTDNLGTTGSTTRTVQVGVTNQPPVAAFNYSPANPAPGTMVLFNASTSYDPDGVITLYTWAFGDGWSGSNPNPTVSHPYAAPGTYSVTLTVTDNLGATGSVTRVVQVGTPGVPGTPVMDGIPGIFIWGSDRWHVTVNAGATWTSAHSYRIELRTDGSFLGVNQSTSGGVAPLGIVPTPTDSGKTLVFEGSLQSGSIDVTFTVAGTTKSIWMSLKLDLDGNGTLEESPSLVYLRGFMVHPPVVPFVVVRPSGTSDTFVPSMNFEIHLAHFYIVGPFGTAMWTGRLTDIATLEGLR